MRIRPNWWIGVAVFLAYAGWVLTAWLHLGIDYREIGSEANLVRAVILPLGGAAAVLAIFLTAAGWWRATLFETPRVRSNGFLGLLLALMIGFIAVELWAAQPASMAPRHLLLLLAATALVGFCEEMTTRGVLLVALRGSTRSEAWVWFGTSALFGLLHATNAFFGIGAMALLQVLLAFCMGTALYLLRRLSGTLLLPMAMHALWDFSTLAAGVTRPETPPPTGVLLALVYTVPPALVFLVLRADRQAADARMTKG